MQDVREIIKEKGRWEGERQGLKKGRQEGRKEGERKGLRKGRQEGERKGRREGRQEGRQEVVLNMLKKKLDTSLISEVTGLSEKAIKKLKNGS